MKSLSQKLSCLLVKPYPKAVGRTQLQKGWNAPNHHSTPSNKRRAPATKYSGQIKAWYLKKRYRYNIPLLLARHSVLQLLDLRRSAAVWGVAPHTGSMFDAEQNASLTRKRTSRHILPKPMRDTHTHKQSFALQTITCES